MKIRELFFLLFIFFATSVGCKKIGPQLPTPPEPPVLSSEKVIESFTITQVTNFNYIDADLVATVSDSDIVLTIPQTVYAEKLIAKLEFKGQAVVLNGQKQESGVTANDFTKPLIYTVVAEDGSSKNYPVKVNFTSELRSAVAQISITTDGGAPINSKDNYVNGMIKIDGKKIYDNYSGIIKIKGRGNSTWGMPKKPYKFKLDASASILGLAPGKSWILLANYIDGSLMCNAVAMKAGQLLRMPFTNHMIPVDVTVNGVYQGSYMLTEDKEVKENRIDIGKNGVLLEMDTNFDQAPWQFKSPVYQLPVMIDYPKLKDMTQDDANPVYQKIKSDFENLEALLGAESFPDNGYRDIFDANSFVNYMIVYILCDNRELNHPKSTYLHQLQGEKKYRMGIIWDFDWAFGYEGTFQHFVTPDVSIFTGINSFGTQFFQRIMQDPQIRSLFKTKWATFKIQDYPKLVNYITEYADIIKESMAEDYKIWQKGSGNAETEKQNLLNWLQQRISYIDSYAGSL